MCMVERERGQCRPWKISILVQLSFEALHTIVCLVSWRKSTANLCISLLFDEHHRHWDSNTPPVIRPESDPNHPGVAALRKTVEAFKTSLNMSEEAMRKVERDTKEQRDSTLWHEVRRYRVTASLFGAVLHRKPDVPPNSLVLNILHLSSSNLRQ